MREPPTGDTHDITFQVSGFHIWTNQLVAHMAKPVINVMKANWSAVMRPSGLCKLSLKLLAARDALYHFDEGRHRAYQKAHTGPDSRTVPDVPRHVSSLSPQEPSAFVTVIIPHHDRPIDEKI